MGLQQLQITLSTNTLSTNTLSTNTLSTITLKRQMYELSVMRPCIFKYGHQYFGETYLLNLQGRVMMEDVVPHNLL